MNSMAVAPSLGFKPALNSKGLRHDIGQSALGFSGFKPALNSKGLRQIN